MSALLLLAPSLPAQVSPVDKFSGTYRIEGAGALQEQGLYHFFYLHPSGNFLLGALWPGHETSRFAGTWSVAGDRMYLNGVGEVDTNQGDWRVKFQRTFFISVQGDGFLLRPLPEKNRYGLIGWPNDFRFYRRQPAPNLPGQEIPRDEPGMLRLIQGLLTRMK